MKRRLAALTLVAAVFTWMSVATAADDKFITVASTTSTENSGLFTHLLPAFAKATGIEVRVVAVGTGQALALGQRGDADVVFVHDRQAELKFVAAGDGVGRREVMYNDFIIVGPTSDPAGIAGMTDSVAAFKKIANAKSTFLSRGDKSGTNEEELRLWGEAAIDVKQTGGDWYRDTGSGMGATLNTAAGIGGYTLADRGTWLSFKNRADLRILVEGDKRLFNQYGVMLVNPERHPNVKREWGQAFIDWLTSPAGQQTIGDYRIGGEQLFFPNYKAPGS
ncbi:MAG TPA: substrate-binding domain-containing protein [Stellaceae bacterium]|nr:substrate-binding domain-containing protein [Stellaceae bacterium]